MAYPIPAGLLLGTVLRIMSDALAVGVGVGLAVGAAAGGVIDAKGK